MQEQISQAKAALSIAGRALTLAQGRLVEIEGELNAVRRMTPETDWVAAQRWAQSAQRSIQDLEKTLDTIRAWDVEGSVVLSRAKMYRVRVDDDGSAPQVSEVESAAGAMGACGLESEAAVPAAPRGVWIPVRRVVDGFTYEVSPAGAHCGGQVVAGALPAGSGSATAACPEGGRE